MTVLFPEATPVLGNLKVIAANAVANMSAPKIATELTGTPALDISCFLRMWNPEITTNAGTAPDRLCTTLSLPQEGRTTIAAIQISYPYDPQAADSTDDNKAKAFLTQGSEKFITVRKGKPFDTALTATTDLSEVWKVRCGRQNRVQSGDDEFAEFEIQQMLFPISLPVYGAFAT